MTRTLETGRRPVELIEREAASTWTEERLTELRRLWVEEALTSSEIAQRLGISRGTVMGKINRLGLLRRHGTPPLQALSSDMEEAQEQETPPATPSAAERGAVQYHQVGQHPTIFELRARHCRFPLGGFRDAEGRLLDEEGMDLPDLRAVCEEVRRSSEELLVEDLDLTDVRFEVTDVTGRIVVSLPVRGTSASRAAA